MVKFGIDCIGEMNEYRYWLKDGRVGLITSITGRDSANRTTIAVLQEICQLAVLFAPEHGIRGEWGAGDQVENAVDAPSGLPVYSLYGSAGKRLSKEMLNCFDILVYDIQDIGVRYYTFLSTLRNALEECAAAGKRLVVLDRPNPLGGKLVEGGMPDPAYHSFVGCHPLPIRYGLTSGEAANLMKEELRLTCDLKVVPCQGWARNRTFFQYGKIWPVPSLALTTFEAALLYPGTCLIEGTNLSEGRGTAAPFRIIGAPFVEGEGLAEAFNRSGLKGIFATPVWFCPTASKHQGASCGGILLHVTEPEKIRPVTVGITLLDLLRTLYPDDYAPLPPHQEGGRPFLALLSGGQELLGDWNRVQVLERYQEDSHQFAQYKTQFHLYP